MRTLVIFGLAVAMSLGFSSVALGQPARQLHAGEIALGIRRLGVTGSVLYVAAHPDDENTRLLAWWAGGRGLRAGYLSMTRGDGGQNLIGTEQDELLGLIRTNELLAARRVDGAEQMFTRARDFGYSKSADETLRIWGHDEVLADVVLAIRRFQPDVIVTRFTTKPPNHGHHTASALLAAEAFTAAADPSRFPEQLGALKPWKADRLLNNVSTWNLAPDADMSAYLKADAGGYEPLLGRSWGEVSAESRSQHRSQGFGVAAERGPLLEYFAPLAGTRPKSELFEGLELSWRRWGGTEKLIQAIDAASSGFDPRAPHLSIPALLRVHEALSALPESHPWKALKLRETEALVAACAGLFLEARAGEVSAVPGSQVTLNLVALNRSPAALRLVSVTLPGGESVPASAELSGAKPFTLSRPVAIPEDARISTPYWLRKPVAGGLYALDAQDRALTGRPEGDPALAVTFVYEAGGKRFQVVRPVVYVWTDPVRGELYRAFEIAPAVTATLEREVVLFPNGTSQSVQVVLAAGRADAAGKLRLEVPPGWRVEPAEVPFQLAARGDERTVRFQITPPKGASERARLRAVVETGGRSESWRVRTVTHEHIPPQVVRQPSEAALVPLALATKVRRVGYIPGPGDRVAESLAAVGYDVTVLPEERLASEKLERFEAILVGVRAFNATPRLSLHRERLLRYVEGGGRLVVQYNTNSRVGPLTTFVGPYPLEIGRERVTDETAAMTPVSPQEPLLRAPNRLGPADFEGWVQERGLYFATTWDAHYQPVFSMNDPGEPPLRGGLLVARHGKGTFIYTGIAFFRQLPAGVPGAYRLLANLLAP
ncbi:NPCBM-associated, NEW3 domain of alpha-galactosidase [Stigmatella aurantiaca]|uniref:NPCBM-associated, NEW3 domain of alpha-galactosidase n=1 Tax=Stigmatella aurantiaca TaxID=41 RepID=A0A1H7U329_STIAU|nr:NPCBM-associated, NEW3 domain of alpha-galactosidase [Stigmatella aurantiaca]